jgi:hypothetical protein
MSKIPKTDPTEQFSDSSWEKGEYVRLRTFISDIAQKEIQDASLEAVQDVPPAGRAQSPQERQQSKMRARLAAGRMAQLKYGIAELNVWYEDGTMIPLTEEGLRDLSSEYVEPILERLTELWDRWLAVGGRTPTQRKKFQEADNRTDGRSDTEAEEDGSVVAVVPRR